MDSALRRHARLARATLEAGVLRGPELFAQLACVPFLERDAWVDAALGIDPPPPDVPGLPPGAVPYLPCGVDEIVAMVRDVPLHATDRLVDLGSGLGRVAMLASLLSGAVAHGIELQEPLVDAARARAAALGLERVTFAHGDAADDAVPLSGSVFFLYAPFNGPLLTRVLERLEPLASRARFVVCAAALELSVPWLSPRPSSSVGLTIYEPSATRRASRRR